MAIFPQAQVALNFMPEARQGPTNQQLEAGSIHITNTTTSPPDAKGCRVLARTTLSGKREPGYLLVVGRHQVVHSK